MRRAERHKVGIGEPVGDLADLFGDRMRRVGVTFVHVLKRNRNEEKSLLHAIRLVIVEQTPESGQPATASRPSRPSTPVPNPTRMHILQRAYRFPAAQTRLMSPLPGIDAVRVLPDQERGAARSSRSWARVEFPDPQPKVARKRRPKPVARKIPGRDRSQCSCSKSRRCAGGRDLFRPMAARSHLDPVSVAFVGR